MVVGSMRQVSVPIAGISSASREQAGGIAAIGDAINAMDASTRDNARHLAEVVSVFRLDPPDGRPALAIR